MGVTCSRRVRCLLLGASVFLTAGCPLVISEPPPPTECSTARDACEGIVALYDSCPEAAGGSVDASVCDTVPDTEPCELMCDLLDCYGRIDDMCALAEAMQEDPTGANLNEEQMASYMEFTSCFMDLQLSMGQNPDATSCLVELGIFGSGMPTVEE